VRYTVDELIEPMEDSHGVCVSCEVETTLIRGIECAKCHLYSLAQLEKANAEYHVWKSAKDKREAEERAGDQ